MTREEMKEGGFYNAFGDCYRFLQRFGKVTADDAFWQAVTAAGSEISRRYDKTPAAKMTNAILIAVYNELERRLSNGCEIAEKGLQR